MHAKFKSFVEANIKDLHIAGEEKKTEENVKRIEDQKMEMELQFVDLVHNHKMKVDETKLKMKVDEAKLKTEETKKITCQLTSIK